MGMNLAEWWLQFSIGHNVGARPFQDDEVLYLKKALERNSETLQNIDRHFTQLLQRFHLYHFHEGRPANVGDKLVYIVKEESAAPAFPDIERAVIVRNHWHMCQFENDTSPGFDMLTEAIDRYAQDAPELIRARWAEEKETQSNKRRLQADELLPNSSDRHLNTTNPEPNPTPFKYIFSVPFPRDKDFIDRKDIFCQIEDQLKVHSCVTICGMGGVG